MTDVKYSVHYTYTLTGKEQMSLYSDRDDAIELAQYIKGRPNFTDIRVVKWTPEDVDFSEPELDKLADWERAMLEAPNTSGVEVKTAPEWDAVAEEYNSWHEN